MTATREQQESAVSNYAQRSLTWHAEKRALDAVLESARVEFQRQMTEQNPGYRSKTFRKTATSRPVVGAGD